MPGDLPEDVYLDTSIASTVPMVRVGGASMELSLLSSVRFQRTMVPSIADVTRRS